MKSGLTKSEKKVLSYWAVVAIILFILALLIGLITISKKLSDDKDYIKNYITVNDENRYATVNNAINKFYSFLNVNDKEATLKILSNKYKESNKVNSNNINKFLTFENNLYYNSRIMCYKNLSKEQMTYLVSGFESNKFTGERLGQKYYQVILDSSNFHFSITPIDKKQFEGGCHE